MAGGRLLFHYIRKLHRVKCMRNTSTDTRNVRSYPLPWPKHKFPQDFEPFWNRVAGKFVIRRVMKTLGCDFSTSDFIEGSRMAIQELASMISDKSRHSELSRVTSPDLNRAITATLDEVQETSSIHLDIESIRNTEIVSFNSIIGEASPGDEHVISELGQKIITSRSRMHGMDQYSISVKEFRELLMEATIARLEFRISVRFKTKEKFVILDRETGQLLSGSNQYTDCQHLWLFTSVVDKESQYPLNWIIADINKFLNVNFNLF